MKSKLLIIDDSQDTHDLLRIFLKDMDLQIDSALDSEHALQLFEQNIYNCIFMDISMPIKNGIELTEIFRDIEQKKTYSHTPIYFITGHCADIVNQGLEKGGDGVIYKPFKKLEIRKILEDIIK